MGNSGRRGTVVAAYDQKQLRHLRLRVRRLRQALRGLATSSLRAQQILDADDELRRKL